MKDKKDKCPMIRFDWKESTCCGRPMYDDSLILDGESNEIL